jgi:hypothetical protein
VIDSGDYRLKACCVTPNAHNYIAVEVGWLTLRGLVLMKPAPPVPCLVLDRGNDDSEETLDSSGLARLASANRGDTSSSVGKAEGHIVCQKSDCI